jgi:zinc/manganese transport system substrate-binding protein
VVRAAYNDPRAADWLAGQAHLPEVVLPFTVGGTEAAKDLFGLYEDSIARLLAAAK